MQTHILTHTADIGPCMDIRAHGGNLYAIQKNLAYPGGRLCVLTPDGELAASYTGIGNARQIDISGSIAIVTAREDGLWIFDVSELQPRLLCHYRTIEFATGATIYANFALVSCRQFGVEIIDITDPVHPKHIGIIRIGEVQSSCVCDGILYGGIWGGMAVAVVDIRDIMHPREIARIPLEGRGDGVFARDSILYAVTGQHPRGIRNTEDHSDPLFGTGNGLSVYDVHDPQNPVQIHRAYFGMCYNKSNDTWRTAVCGNMIVCGCSSLGIFAYDISTYEPLLRLEFAGSAGMERIDTRSLEGVTGFASLGTRLYVTTTRNNLYIHDTGMQLGECDRWDTDERFPTEPHPFTVENVHGISLRQIYTPADDSSVLDICDCGDCYAAACAMGGLRILDREFREIAAYPTDTFCVDVKYANGLLAAALTDGGIGLWKMEGMIPRRIGGIRTEQSATQLHLTPDGKYLFAAAGSTLRLLYDVSDPTNPTQLCRDGGTMMYGDNFLRGTLADGTVCFCPHRSGLLYANPAAGDTEFRKIFYEMNNGCFEFLPESGADTDGERIFYTMHGGYVLLPMEEGHTADALPIHRAETPICGKITLRGNLMIAAERARGLISVTDISDIEHPKTVGSLYTSASPGKPIILDGRIMIAGSHAGLAEVIL
ncbi:MAG: hypothetical protein E7662_12115 [Ruminococcaceae bacterium]|nr:hypothetical protein [Oscillospiraceae bacterium]